MKDKFQMSSMGELTFFLRLQVKQKKDGIFISQDKYVSEILKKFGLSKRKSASTPIDAEKPLLKDSDGEDVDVHTYRSMIGSLMYLTSSRPDIMFAVCACARFQVTPKVSHLNAVKRIFRYLKGKPYLGLWNPKDSPFDLVAYSDSDYVDPLRKDLDKDEGIELVVDQVKDANIVETEGRHAAEQAEKEAEIYHLDLDHPSKVLSMQEDDSEVQEVVDVVTTAKLITDVVTAATSQVSAASATISVAKPSIPAAAPTITESEARKNMMIYLKNTAGYKLDFFKGMSYDEICLIFQASFDANMRFLFKSREEMKEEV
nr:uncharacterized mitochondrial protein AtMg00810-like [Tanacetum cinerariifolium]GFA55675.1 uncharacterized mitochondrial protein AtMg00810-like [Tanacetum cinerariifolium]